MPNPQTLALLSDYASHSLHIGLLKSVALSTLTPLARAWTAIIDLAHELPTSKPEALSEALVEALPYLPAHTVVVCLGSACLIESSPVLLYRPSYEQVFIAANASQLEAFCLAFSEEVWQLFALTNKALRWHLASPKRAHEPSQTQESLHVLVPTACYLLNHWQQGGESLEFLKQAGEEV